MTALYPTWTWGDVDLSAPPFAFGFGSDLGAPQTATEALAQLLTDGEIEVSTRASNRTLAFTVYVESVDLLASAEAERLLALEADKSRNTLTFDPGDGYAPATVFETFRAQMSFVRDDDAEMSGLRRYDIVMKASPSGLSANYVETQALGPTVAVPTVTTINAGTAVTNWTGSLSLTDMGSNLRVSSAGTTPSTATYRPPAPVDLTGSPYVSLVMWGNGKPADLFINGGTVVGEYVLAANVGGTTDIARYYWRVPPATIVTEFTFSLLGGFSFNSLQRTDGLPIVGSPRQLQRTIAVHGSARTQGSLAVEHETSALGSTLVYTWPTDELNTYSPPLRPFLFASGTIDDDTSLVSGHRNLLDTAVIFDVPVNSLISGTHQLMARLRSDSGSAQTITYTAQLRQNGNNVGPATTGNTVVTFTGTPSDWRYAVLARLMLPTTAVPTNSTAVMRITIVAASPGVSNIDLDEAWLFNTSVGDLTWVECGTGTASDGGPSKRLWLDAATVALPRPTVFRGFAADRSDATFPSATELMSFGTHTFSPPTMNVLTVTSNALDAAVSLTHRPAWHTHAAS